MNKPLIIQSDMTILLEVNTPDFELIRSELSGYAELEKSPEYIHTYRITPISIWNADSAGLTYNVIEEFLLKYSKYEVPENVLFEIRDLFDRCGRFILISDKKGMILKASDPLLLKEVRLNKRIGPFLLEDIDGQNVYINPNFRGYLKKEFIELGYPVKDEAGYVKGTHLDFVLKEYTESGREFILRDYQKDALNAFCEKGAKTGGSGTIVLPCGAGKTIVGIGAINEYQCQTLILTTNIIALRQWITELLDKTMLKKEDIGEYSGEYKQVRPITVATYNILTYRRSKKGIFEHFGLFSQNNWGLIIYDEVHLLPAPVFRVTAEIQARRRLGLTATLVREDGLETDVFSLIGPKKYDVPWKDLENKSWIAKAICHEIRVSMNRDLRLKYISAGKREQFRLASENSDKFTVIESLIAMYSKSNILIIGQYINQLEYMSKKLGLPIITGKTPTQEREALYGKFKAGEIKILIVSKVANFAIDLPDANVAIQISGTYGSRQEEAQRLGRILRPKSGDNTAYFYTIVTNASLEQTYASKRQLFLTEQGYKYTIEKWAD